jgi:putative transposase
VITGKPEHLKTFDYTGVHQYFLTFCTYQRRMLFVSRECTDVVYAQFLRAAADEGFAILAYCFMPDHVHLLVEGQHADSDCRRFIARAKQFSGFHFQKTFGQCLWQRYGFERSLRAEESALAVARYILENPIRARLVERVEDYPFLGSSVYTVDEILEAVQMGVQWYRSG